MARSVKRSLGFAAFVAPFGMVVALSACGDDDSSAPATLVEIKPSSFVTSPTTAAGATTPPAGSAVTGEPGEVSTAEQSYEIESGDSLSGIASTFGITIDEITNFNNWADGSSHLLVPGETVRIPPGAEFPAPDDDADEDESDSDEDDGGENEDDGEESESTEEASDDPELCPDGSRQGTYTIEDTDTTRVGVADRLEATVAQLDEANADTRGYDAFFPGLEILVPCSGEADESDTE